MKKINIIDVVAVITGEVKDERETTYDIKRPVTVSRVSEKESTITTERRLTQNLHP